MKKLIGILGVGFVSTVTLLNLSKSSDMEFLASKTDLNSLVTSAWAQTEACSRTGQFFNYGTWVSYSGEYCFDENFQFCGVQSCCV